MAKKMLISLFSAFPWNTFKELKERLASLPFFSFFSHVSWMHSYIFPLKLYYKYIQNAACHIFSTSKFSIYMSLQPGTGANTAERTESIGKGQSPPPIPWHSHYSKIGLLYRRRRELGWGSQEGYRQLGKSACSKWNNSVRAGALCGTAPHSLASSEVIYIGANQH